jgi:NADH-quinone oxidoreductase subunit D
MRELLDAIPDAIAQVPSLEETDSEMGILPPDDGDLIRPQVEEELSLLGTQGALVNLRSTRLAKHLVWTFGPHHRDFPFMLQLRVEIDGEQLVTVDPEIGWLHQGIEKLLESCTYTEGFDLMERLNPENSVGHQMAWALACEKLWGIEKNVPQAAQLWRVIAGELARICEHLKVMNATCMLHSKRAAQATFFEAGEKVAKLLELAAFTDGQCLFRAIGGLRQPVPKSVPEMIERTLPDILATAQKLSSNLAQDPAVVDGLKGLGAIEKKEALGLGLSGPALRACGCAYDTRIQNPYFAYDRIVPRMATAEGGGTLARFAVRQAELHNALSLVLRALAAYQGLSEDQRCDVCIFDTASGEPLPPPAVGTAFANMEMANGKLTLFLASDGSEHPHRARIHGPSFSLAAALPRLLDNAHLDHVVPILRSLGMIGSEMDR